SCFASLASLNMLDKVPDPLAHLQEIDRAAKERDVQCLISDPFSWSTDTAQEDLWLGGTEHGKFPGLGIDNVQALLQSSNGYFSRPWTVKNQDQIWWKIRTHANHFELIRSCFVHAAR
ncbi:MAG: SAM-dependent methyltransferase, partial [Desulfohalobiaceae bacterium]